MHIRFYVTDRVLIGSVILKLIFKIRLRKCGLNLYLRNGMSGCSCENGNDGLAENFFEIQAIIIRYWRVLSLQLFVYVQTLYILCGSRTLCRKLLGFGATLRSLT
jgi:hypothetical protein